MAWLFETKRSTGRRREREVQAIKQEEAGRMMADLFMRHNSMTTGNIIGELEQMHGFYAVASWEPSEEPGGSYFCDIVKDLTHTPLTRGEIGRLVSMLPWPELRSSQDREAPSCLVSVAMQGPSEAFIPTLTEHFAWLENEIKRLPPTQYRADIASEMRLTKAAIQACRLRP
jgi:hypothetical protein